VVFEECGDRTFEFGLSVCDDTVYRDLKDLGFSHVSARPKAYKQDTDAME